MDSIITPLYANFVEDGIGELLDEDCGLSIGYDAWSCGQAPGSSNKRSFIGVTASLVCSDWERRNVVVGVQRLKQSHTAVKLADTVSNVLQRASIELAQVAAVCTDNASAETASAKLLVTAGSVGLGPDDQGLLHAPCIAHTFDLAVNDGLDLPLIKKIVAASHDMVKRLCSRRVLIEKLGDLHEHLRKTAKVAGAVAPLGVVPKTASATVVAGMSQVAVSVFLAINFISYLTLLHFSRI